MAPLRMTVAGGLLTLGDETAFKIFLSTSTYCRVLEMCMVVWTWSGPQACLFWSCIDVIVVRVKVSRGIVPFSPLVIDSADTSKLPNGEICKSHLLPNNQARQQ
jgi:hypothetical protein